MKFLETGLEANNQWYRYLGLILASFIGGQFLGLIPFLIIALTKGLGSGHVGDLENPTDLSGYGIDTTTTLVILMIPFLVSIIFYVVFFKTIHKRSWITSINGTGKIRWKRFFFGFLSWGGIGMVLFIISYLISPSDYTIQFDISKWVPLLLIALLIIPFQASYEELLFRGYLAQGVAAITKNRWVAILIPSILFALVHGANPEIEKYGFWIMMPVYFTLGITYAIISVLDDGIEIAMGAHTVNNIFSAVVVNYEGGALVTDAAFLQKKLDPEMELIALIIISALFCFALTKKFNWDWSVFRKKVVAPTPDDSE